MDYLSTQQDKKEENLAQYKKKKKYRETVNLIVKGTDLKLITFFTRKTLTRERSRNSLCNVGESRRVSDSYRITKKGRN